MVRLFSLQKEHASLNPRATALDTHRIDDKALRRNALGLEWLRGDADPGTGRWWLHAASCG
jgi:hypothetical protein